jgi:Zn-dependent protease with chaperone function
VDNLASAVKVGPKQLSTVHGLLQDAARALDLEGPIPDVYVRQSPVPNAYTLAVGGLSPSSSPLSTFWADRRPFVVVHTSLLDLLTQDELKAVLAHELAHLKCNHGLYLASANALASGASGLLGPLVAPALESALLRWLRAAELTCDRGALLATGCPRVVVGALMKLAGGSNTYARELSVDAFLEQARQYQDAVSDGFGRAIGASQSRALTHPHPVVRAKEIDRWAGSAQYRRLAAEVEAGGDGGAAASAAWSASR